MEEKMISYIKKLEVAEKMISYIKNWNWDKIIKIYGFFEIEIT